MIKQDKMLLAINFFMRLPPARLYSKTHLAIASMSLTLLTSPVVTLLFDRLLNGVFA